MAEDKLPVIELTEEIVDKIEELPAKVAKVASAVEIKVAAGVEAFIAAHLRNSSFSRDTEAWNHFQAGIPVLIGAIVAELEG